MQFSKYIEKQPTSRQSWKIEHKIVCIAISMKYSTAATTTTTENLKQQSHFQHFGAFMSFIVQICRIASVHSSELLLTWS